MSMSCEIQYRNTNRIREHENKAIVNTIAGHTYKYVEKEYKKNRIKITWFKPSGFTMI